MNVKNRIRLAGLLILLGMAAGIFSVAPAVDATDYLREAAQNANQVLWAAVFQLLLSLAYMAFAILVYPVVKGYSGGWSLGFLSFRILAVGLSVTGTVVLLAILFLSEEFVQTTSSHLPAFKALGSVLKNTRDMINHVFMVIMLCMGNIMLYLLFIKSRLLPRWMSIWGIAGSVLSVIASILVLFGIADIITPEYLLLNAPTGLFELVFGVWLMGKGLE